MLPSFGVIPTFGAIGGIGSVPGLSFNFAHAAARRAGHRDPPADPDGRDRRRTRGASPASTTRARRRWSCSRSRPTTRAGEPLFTNRFSLFLRGEGGFGGESGPKAGNEAPTRAPDGVVESPTLPQQALIYRLSGDKNPLHADPDFAKMGGFDKPILHGLCSYGIVCKAVVDEVLGGDVTKVARYQARFAGVGLPRRDDRHVLLEGRRQDPDPGEVEGARRGDHLERGHHDPEIGA